MFFVLPVLPLCIVHPPGQADKCVRVGVCEKKWLKKSVCKSDHGEIVKEIGLERREDGEIVREMCVFVFCKE